MAKSKAPTSGRTAAEVTLLEANELLEKRTADLRAANHSLRESESRLAGIVESAMDAIVSVDADQRIVLFNRAAEKMFGCPASEALGHSLDRFIPVRFRAHHRDHVEGFGKTGVTGRAMGALGSLSGLRADGGEFPIEASISQLDVDGQKIFTVILRDITERTQAEARLRESERFARSTVDALSANLAILDEEGTIIAVNRAWREFAAANGGRPDFIWEGANYLAVCDATDDPEAGAFAAGIRAVLGGTQSRFIAEYPCHAPGRQRWFVGIATPFQPGGLRRVVVVHENVSDRYLAEQAMRESEERFRRIANSLPQLVWTMNESGDVTFYNERFEEFTGQKMLAGSTFLDAIHPDERQGTIEIWTEALRSGVAVQFEQRLRRADGVFRWHLVRGVPVRDAEGKVRDWYGSATDVHEQRQYRDELDRRAQEVHDLNTELETRVMERTAQLEAANKELEAFSYSVSHDLRAPLRSMDGFSQAVLEEYGSQLPASGRRYLEMIRQAAQRMGNLVDDLLAFSRLGRQPLQRRPVSMVKLVEETLAELAPLHQGRDLDIDVADLPNCEGDRSLLKQVWVNLLSNALKYTRPRQRAVIEVGCSEGVYFVRDNGTGFDMRYAGKLFGVFQRLHRAEDFEGTGVGLAIVQRIIHRHGGRVWAEAAPDRGATFHFTLEGGSET